MGCGSSSQPDPNPAAGHGVNYNTHPNYTNRTMNPEHDGYYPRHWEEENRYYGENMWENNRLLNNSPGTSEPRPQPSAEVLDTVDDDETAFDDDGVIEREKYSREETGIMTKMIDFRKKYLDEKPEMRPKIDPDKLFVDTTFPLSTAILKDNKNVEWKRPKEFIDDPRLFTDGATQCDIGQGMAGTCWFLSVVAEIAGNDRLLRQVIPASAYYIEDRKKYDGVFCARFFSFGKWENVYIDDYLPVIPRNQLWGAKSASDPRELWVALLEKAFAKLHGSYDAVYGGQPGDAYMFLTGGLGENVELQSVPEDRKATVLYDRVRNALNSGSLVTCVVPDEHDNYKGLVGGHAYSLVGVCEVKDNRTKLIKLRNPWGEGEWKGAWSDGSPEWSQMPRNSVAPPNRDDGEFYISLSDFMKYFTWTTICSLTPDFDSDGKSDSLNYVLSIFGEWNGKTAAGYHNLLQNQRFGFTVPNQGLVNNDYMPVVVQIVQKCEKRKSENISMRCDVFRILSDKTKPKGRRLAVELLGTMVNVYTPELQTTFRHKLKPGRYMVVASTAERGQEKAFLLRLFTTAPLQNIKEIPQTADIISLPSESDADLTARNNSLSFEKVLFGEFVSGFNAGGQISNLSSYHQNPQYLVTVPNTGRPVPLSVSVTQLQREPKFPLGIKLFQLEGNTKPPADARYLYQHYDSSPANTQESQGKFVLAWNVSATYMLPAGRYLVLIHLDKPNTEKIFNIVFKSNVNLAIKGFQTG